MNFEAFHPFVLPYVGSCPTQTVDHHLRQAAIEFCSRALVWVERLDTLIGEPQRFEFTLPLDDQVELVKLMRVQLDGRDAEVIGGGPGGVERRRIYVTSPTAWLADRRTLRVEPAPADGQGIDVWAALKPSQGAFSFPDEVFAHHAQHIAHGALGSLFRIPAQTWTELGLAEYHEGRFRADTATQARVAERAWTRRTPRDPASRFR